MKKQSNHDAEYRTGQTSQPQKSSALIAVLLVLVILFGGLASILSIMNIRLMTKLSLLGGSDSSIAFSATEPVSATAQVTEAEKAGTVLSIPNLGLEVETVSEFLQSYYDLPAGVYITAVEDGSVAQAADCLPGDIITAANDTPITEANGLSELSNNTDILTLTLYRGGTEHTVRLVIK